MARSYREALPDERDAVGQADLVFADDDFVSGFLVESDFFVSDDVDEDESDFDEESEDEESEDEPPVPESEAADSESFLAAFTVDDDRLSVL